MLLFLHSERRSNLKLQPVAPVPLEHLDPQTPQLSQLVSRWQKLWLLAVARQSRLEQHQQTLKEVIVPLKCHHGNLKNYNLVYCSRECLISVCFLQNLDL